ncbi:natural resistance-associated macrophage protein-domain-containing protein [Cerioporus squamosus]|nr:natural resistance-associated macrophage protein-domain-containing protein [Cerioporus squamosus]
MLDAQESKAPVVVPPPSVPAMTTETKAKTEASTLGWLRRAQRMAWVVVQHATKHTGVGIVCAVAYFDPGNWGVDLQAGSEFGYKLLFVVLLAGIFAIFMQTQASRLGCVTGLNLASHCRLLLHDRPKHKLLWRWLALYPLYVLAEIAIISTDLAELLGSAIALCMLFPTLPLWAGPVRMFELFIAVLVFIVLICMGIIISKARVHWGDAFDGFLPSKTVFRSDALYTSIGIIGATVMPHSLFLGSALATQDRLSSTPPSPTPKPPTLSTVDSTLSTDSDVTISSTPSANKRGPYSLLEYAIASVRRHFRVLPSTVLPDEPKSHAEHENKPLAFVRAHLYHGIVDMVVSLLGLAVVINALILILSAAVFFSGDTGSAGPASLFDAYDLLQTSVGKPAAILFALALLASGQSSSIIATLAGQIVSEGFIRWRLSPVMRRLFTRCLGLVPALVVAAALGRAGIDTLLVASQVILSIVLPFIVFPLLWLTSSKSVMSVKKPLERSTAPAPASAPASSGDGASPASNDTADALALEEQTETVDFSIGRITTGVGYVIWLIIVMANVYAIVGLGLGEGV